MSYSSTMLRRLSFCCLLAALDCLLLASVSCGPKDATPAEEPHPGEQAEPEKIARTVLSLELTAGDGETASAELVMTNENGASDRVALGTWPATCRRVATTGPSDTTSGELIRVDCRQEPGGVEFRLVRRRDQLFVLEAKYDNPTDERTFEERKRIAIPGNQKVEAAPLADRGERGQPGTEPAEDEVAR